MKTSRTNNAQDGDIAPNNTLGRFLLSTLSLAPKVSPADLERMFNTHIQDVLLVSYLANTIRTQIDLSNRLALHTFAKEESKATTTTATTTTAPASK